MLIKVLVLVFCGLLSIALALVGVIVLASGGFAKKRSLVRTGVLSLLAAFLVAFSASSYVAIKGVNLTTTIRPRDLWRSAVGVMEEASTRVEPIPLNDTAYHTMFGGFLARRQIRNCQAVMSESPGFTSFYFRYDAERPFVLGLVSGLPSVETPDVASDKVCQSATWEEVAESVSPHTVTGKKLLDNVPFWQPEGIVSKECYRCLKFPWDHTLLFDRNSDIVYHVIAEVAP